MAKKAAKQQKTQKVDPSLRKKGAYPYYLLSSSIKLGEVVWQSGGDRVGVPKSVVAAALNSDQGGSAFAQLVASAKCYGIVDGYTELVLTDLGRDYFMPMSDTAKRAAELSFLKQPPVYEFLISKFDGSTLPAPGILSNLLGREFGIPKSWSARVAQTFVTIASEIGVLDQGGRLRFHAAVHASGGGSRSDQAEGHEESHKQIQGSISVGSELTRGDVFYSGPSATAFLPAGRRTVDPLPNQTTTVWSHEGLRVETPVKMTKVLWQKLTKYVALMEPTDGTTEVAQVVLSPERPE
jgi:hypothetical protein